MRPSIYVMQWDSFSLSLCLWLSRYQGMKGGGMGNGILMKNNVISVSKCSETKDENSSEASSENGVLELL